jgi:Ion channel
MMRMDTIAAAPDRIAVLLPLAVAVGMTFSTVVIHALALIPIVVFVGYEFRAGRAGVQFSRDVRTIVGATLVLLAAHMVAIATWAVVFSFCGEFPQLTTAVYHSGMNYTTLGDSDKVMSPSWRFLAPLEAANGMLMFGVSTATLFGVIQRMIQTKQSQSG